MEIQLTRNGKPIGVIDYDVQDPEQCVGRIRSVQTEPQKLGRRIAHYLRSNPDDLRIWGGQPAERLDFYLEGMAQGLDALKRVIKGFDWSWPIEKIVPRSAMGLDGKERVG